MPDLPPFTKAHSFETERAILRAPFSGLIARSLGAVVDFQAAAEQNRHAIINGGNVP